MQPPNSTAQLAVVVKLGKILSQGVRLPSMWFSMWPAKCSGTTKFANGCEASLWGPRQCCLELVGLRRFSRDSPVRIYRNNTGPQQLPGLLDHWSCWNLLGVQCRCGVVVCWRCRGTWSELAEHRLKHADLKQGLLMLPRLVDGEARRSSGPPAPRTKALVRAALGTGQAPCWGFARSHQAMLGPVPGKVLGRAGALSSQTRVH
ncbi:hypothetical protein NL676_007121 [Syzygium grande]|nr:hypothetical protein NL676_007121 [Syzygium grande]